MVAQTLEVTNFHLGSRQKLALKKRAAANGTNVAEEIRHAVDAYLSGITADELKLLDALTLQAERDIGAMNDLLDATNRRAAAVFAELETLRGGGASSR